MQRRLVAVAFDVCDDRRRARFGKFLGGFGQRVQYSVFEVLVRPSDADDFAQELASRLDLETDRLKLYPLCVECRARVLSYGTPLASVQEDAWII